MAFDKFKARQKIVKQRMTDNKVFVFGAAIILLFLVFQVIEHKDDPDAVEFRHPEGYVQQQDTNLDGTQKVATSSNFSEEITQKNQEENLHWRFYWSDLAILGIGSAICGTMIIKERRKAREKL